MGAIISFIKKTSFYRFYNYDDCSSIDSEEDYRIQNYQNYSDYHEIPYYGEINSKNLYDTVYNTYTGYESDFGVIYKIKD